MINNVEHYMADIVSHCAPYHMGRYNDIGIPMSISFECHKGSTLVNIKTM